MPGFRVRGWGDSVRPRYPSPKSPPSGRGLGGRSRRSPDGSVIGVGGASLWRREMPFYALRWRRYRPYFHTCANNTLHLRPKCLIPAPDQSKAVKTGDPAHDGAGSLFLVVSICYSSRTGRIEQPLKRGREEMPFPPEELTS